MKTFKYIGQEAKNLGRFGMVSTGDVLQLNNSEAVSVSDNPEFELFADSPSPEKKEGTNEKAVDVDDAIESGEEEKVKAPEEEAIPEEEKADVAEEAKEAVEQVVEETTPKSKRERRKA